MINSIRSFLLFNLFLSVTLISVLTVVGNLFLEHRGFQLHLDSQLTLAAHTIRAFIIEDHQLKQMKKIQTQMNEIPEYMHTLDFNYNEEIDDLNLLLKSIQFQVWKSNGELLLHSFAAPNIALNKKTTGFHNIWHHAHNWRTFVLNLPAHKLQIIVLQRDNFRTELESKITKDSIMMMLITYPLLALLIWIIVGRGLSSIRATAQAIKKRAPNKLTQIRNLNVPTELLPLVDELNSLFLRLSEAFDREKRFASNAAHELRTPLAAIKIQVQVAMQNKNVNDIHVALKKVLKTIDRSTRIVQQLLTLSRIVPEASINAPSTIKLEQLLATNISELLIKADEKSMKISLDAPKSLPSIVGNKTSLSILLRNLIDNAIRYSPPHSDIHIILTPKKETVMLEIIDNGPGIPEELKDRVFEPFFRIIGTQEKGTGLGLSIVKQIIDLHKGSIEIHSPKTHAGLAIKIELWYDFTCASGPPPPSTTKGV